MTGLDEGDLLDPPPSRPLWLWTLADLALLLIGFFVLVQATDRQALAKGLREGFGGKVPDIVAPADPIPLASSVVSFAPNSAIIQSADGLAEFAETSLKDPRVTLRVAGATLAKGDADPATGSTAILAGDRARATVAYLIARGVAADRIMIATSGTGRAGALVTMSFTGDPRGLKP